MLQEVYRAPPSGRDYRAPPDLLAGFGGRFAVEEKGRERWKGERRGRKGKGGNERKGEGP